MSERPELTHLFPNKDRQRVGYEMRKVVDAIGSQEQGVLAAWEFGEFEAYLSNFPATQEGQLSHIEMRFDGKEDGGRLLVASVVPKKRDKALFVGLEYSIVDFFEVACRALEDGVRPGMIESAAREAINGYKKGLPKDHSRGDRYLHDQYLHETINWAWGLRSLFGKLLSEKKYL